MGKIKVVIKKPLCIPVVKEIDNTLEELQSIVEGYIESVTIDKEVVMICNEEGRIRDLPFNCKLRRMTLFGTIIFAGHKKDELINLPERYLDYVSEMYK